MMGVIGGSTVAFADRTSATFQGAIGVNFALAALCAVLGLAASRGVRSRA